MKFNIKATNIELTPDVRAYVEKKLSAVEKYLDGNVDTVAQVEVGKTTQHHKSGEVFKAEVHIVGGGVDVFAVSEQFDLYAAIDVLKDDVVQKLMHLKGKREALTRRGARAIKNMMKGFNPFKRRG